MIDDRVALSQARADKRMRKAKKMMREFMLELRAEQEQRRFDALIACVECAYDVDTKEMM
jgi:hypothetical protein